MSKVKSTIHQWQQEWADSLAKEEDRKIMAGVNSANSNKVVIKGSASAANKKWTEEFRAAAQKDLDRLDASNAAPLDIPTPIEEVHQRDLVSSISSIITLVGGKVTIVGGKGLGTGSEGWVNTPMGQRYFTMYKECYRPVTSVLADRLRSKDLRMKTLRDEVDLWETRAEALRVAFCDTVDVLRQMRVEYGQVTRDDFPNRNLLGSGVNPRPFDKKFLDVIVLCGSCDGSGVSELWGDEDRRDVEPGGDYEDQCEYCLGTGYDTQSLTNRAWQRREYKS